MKKIFIVSGLPGAGKSTQTKTLEGLLPMSQTFHLGKWAKEKKLRDEGARAQGKLLPFENAVFFLQEALAFCGHVIFDGFPRAVAEVNLLMEQVGNTGAEVILLSFEFPGTLEQQLEQSQLRQIHRHERAGEAPDFNRIQGKIARVRENDLVALNQLKGCVNEVHVLDASQTEAVLRRHIRRIGIQHLPWDKQVLEAVHQAEQELGQKMYAASSVAYGPFWGGKFGPLQASFDADVALDDASGDTEKALAALVRADRTIRWAVAGPSDLSEWLGVPTPETTIDIAPLTCQAVGVRLSEDGLVEVLERHGALEDLVHGRIRLNERVWQESGNAPKVLEVAMGRAHSFIGKYPGLNVEGILAEMIGWIPKPPTPPAEMRVQVQAVEKGGRPLWNNPKFSAEAVTLLWEIATAENAPRPVPTARPWHPPTTLPAPLAERHQRLEEAREAKPILSPAERTEIAFVAPPVGYSSWLQYVAMTATDNQWREWLTEQNRSRYPVGGFDPDVQFVRKKTQTGEQKLTHMGTPLWGHLLHGSLEIRADEVRNLVGADYSWVAALRCGMLVHDVGKLKNSNTPGGHQGAGANIIRAWFDEGLFAWMPDHAKRMVEWVVRNHDLFGRFCRATGEKTDARWGDPQFSPLLEPRYRGALGVLDMLRRIEELEVPRLPDAIRIARLVWEADAGSVPTLRWALPQGERVEKLLSLCV